MSPEDAKEYVSAKLVVLVQRRDYLEGELNDINEQIAEEMAKLMALQEADKVIEEDPEFLMTLQETEEPELVRIPVMRR